MSKFKNEDSKSIVINYKPWFHVVGLFVYNLINFGFVMPYLISAKYSELVLLGMLITAVVITSSVILIIKIINIFTTEKLKVEE